MRNYEHSVRRGLNSLSWLIYRINTPVLRDIFTGPEFLSAEAYHAQVKSPVELVIGSLKALNVQNIGPDVTQVLRRMGLELGITRRAVVTALTGLLQQRKATGDEPPKPRQPLEVPREHGTATA